MDQDRLKKQQEQAAAVLYQQLQQQQQLFQLISRCELHMTFVWKMEFETKKQQQKVKMIE